MKKIVLRPGPRENGKRRLVSLDFSEMLAIRIQPCFDQFWTRIECANTDFAEYSICLHDTLLDVEIDELAQNIADVAQKWMCGQKIVTRVAVEEYVPELQNANPQQFDLYRWNIPGNAMRN